MKTDPIIAELRKTRAELDKQYPTAEEFQRHLAEQEKRFADRLVRPAPVPRPRARQPE